LIDDAKGPVSVGLGLIYALTIFEVRFSIEKAIFGFVLHFHSCLSGLGSFRTKGSNTCVQDDFPAGSLGRIWVCFVHFRFTIFDPCLRRDKLSIEKRGIWLCFVKTILGSSRRHAPDFGFVCSNRYSMIWPPSFMLFSLLFVSSHRLRLGLVLS
jgi:hypothetical protein